MAQILAKSAQIKVIPEHEMGMKPRISTEMTKFLIYNFLFFITRTKFVQILTSNAYVSVENIWVKSE